MALQLIKESKNTEISLSNIPINDKKTFDLISTGETIGIFQLE